MWTTRNSRRPAVADRNGGVPSGSRAAAVPSALVFLTAAWLTAGPLFWKHRHAGGGAAADLNEILVGAALMTVALVRVVFPLGTSLLSIVNSLLGVWLVASPFVLGYSIDSRMTTNNVIVGTVVIVLATSSWLTARFIATTDTVRPTPSPQSIELETPRE